MLKLKSKPAFTCIEVLCATSIVILIFLFIVTVNLNIEKIKNTKDNVSRYSYFLEALKNKIETNTNYEEIIALKGNYIYIKEENIYVKKLESTSIKDLVQLEAPIKEPYIKGDFTGDSVIKIDLELYYSEFNKNFMKKMYFFKGNY